LRHKSELSDQLTGNDRKLTVEWTTDLSGQTTQP